MDSLTLRSDGDTVDRSVATARIRRAERYTVRRSASATIGGLLIGSAAGALVGEIEARQSFAHCEREPGHDLCGLAGIEVPFLAAGGAVVGLVVGALVKLPRWDRVF